MKQTIDLAPIVDRFKFAFASAGWPGLAGVVLMTAGIAILITAVPHQRELAASNQAIAERAHQDYLRMATAEGQGKLTGAEALIRFRERLSPDIDADSAFEIIQRDAQKNGLAPIGTEYKWQRTPGTGLAEVSIAVPMKAGYPPVRAFVKDVLADVPGLALDQFEVQRESIAVSVVDARLRFTLYLKTEM